MAPYNKMVWGSAVETQLIWV